MSKKKLARAIGVCIIAITIIVVVTLFSACESSPTPPTYGLELDGVDDYVALGNATVLGFTSQDFTIEAWIKPGVVARGMTIFQRHGWDSDGYRLQTGSAGDLKFYTFQPGGNQLSRTSSDLLIAGNWYHVAVVRQGASVRIFVNGADETGIAGSHMDCACSVGRNATVGVSYGPEAFYGVLSEVRVWNYTCSQSEIETHMSDELTGTEEGLLGYWRLNEGSGTIAHDSTANNNSGTLLGGPVWLTGGS